MAQIYRLAKLKHVEIEEQHIPEPFLPATPGITSKADPQPDNPPWNGWAALAVWAFSVALIVIIPNIFAVTYLLVNGIAFTPELRSNPEVQFVALTAMIPVHILTLVVAVLVVTRRGQFSLSKTLGFESGGYRWWHYLLILIAFIAVAMVVLRFFPEQENDMTRLLKSSRSAVILVAIIATVSAPVIEEIIYRGLLYSAFQRSLGRGASIVLVTLLFAGVHFFQYWGSPGTIILIVILSLTLTLIRSTSKNLWPCIVFHTLFNGIQSILLIVEPYLRTLEVPEPTAFLHHLLK